MMHAPTITKAGFVLPFFVRRHCVLNAILSMMFVVTVCPSALAGGGMVLEGDTCIVEIDFYRAHFTAYQPVNNGNEQFCQELPDTGETIFVFDYLHDSLKEVPVDFRVIHNVTGQGEFVKLKHVEAMGDLAAHTVFYEPSRIQKDGSLKIEHDFTEKGSYVGIINAGHPSNDNIYTAVFPFEVGRSGLGYLPLLALPLLAAAYFIRRRNGHDRQKPSTTAAAS